MGYDVHVVRTTHWLDARTDPIGKPDVDAAIDADPDLAWSGTDYVDMTDDGGTVTRYFMITWRGVSTFWWYRDQLLCKDPSQGQIAKLVDLARTLQARVVGDEGERYDLKPGLFGRRKLVITPPAA